jgi:hypothetical protein
MKKGILLLIVLAASLLLLCDTLTVSAGIEPVPWQPEINQPQESLIAQRVETMRQVRDVFREIAALPLPPGLSVVELAEAKRYVEWLKAWAVRLDKLATKGESAIGVAAGGSRSQERLLMPSANKQMQEMSESFNLQYLHLQSQISDENRRFALVYSIMKNKHDTAKNAIGKLR